MYRAYIVHGLHCTMVHRNSQAIPRDRSHTSEACLYIYMYTAQEHGSISCAQLSKSLVPSLQRLLMHYASMTARASILLCNEDHRLSQQVLITAACKTLPTQPAFALSNGRGSAFTGLAGLNCVIRAECG